MRIVFLVIVLASVFQSSGCRHNNDNGNVCDSPIEVTGANDSLGYMVKVKEGIDVNTVATNYVETHVNDINVYSIIGSANIFAAEMNDAVLSKLRCDSRIETISYNSPVPAT